GLGPTQFHDDGTAVAIGEEHLAALAAAGSAAPDGPAAGRLRRPGACRRANDGLRIIPGERAPTRAPRRGLLEEKTRWHSATTRAAARRTDRHALRARRLGQHRPPSCNEDNRKQDQSAHSGYPESICRRRSVGDQVTHAWRQAGATRTPAELANARCLSEGIGVDRLTLFPA